MKSRRHNPLLRWVLRCYSGYHRGRYWCGGGNPLMPEPTEGTRYESRREARRQAVWLRDELNMGRFTPERLKR